MQEGLILSKKTKEGFNAEILCASYTPESIVDDNGEVAIIELRFSGNGNRKARHPFKVRERFSKVFPDLDCDALQSTGEVLLEFTCPEMDGKLWDCMIAHCKSLSSTDYIISTFSSLLETNPD